VATFRIATLQINHLQHALVPVAEVGLARMMKTACVISSAAWTLPIFRSAAE
jgi:hypothetical protein